MERWRHLIPGSISSLPTISYQSRYKEFVKIAVSFPLHRAMQGLITGRENHPLVIIRAVWALSGFQAAGQGPGEAGPRLRSVPGSRPAEGADSHTSIPGCCREHSLPGMVNERDTEWMNGCTNEWVSSSDFQLLRLLCYRGAGSGLSSELGHLKAMCWWHKYSSIPKTVNSTVFFSPEHFVLDDMKVSQSL